ncbi:nuclear transport factor 2 family protein [Undibacterium fentianense]|uniref:Nuclear transport factor 2 family protein n=1 Tax=Undibacterium fentianense TaxID=2828728 RepID=A0A941E387_9BURK|nr:nuclear transport factor 2 family protein [Undibacterium fentianense]MBR7801535.1 nuclear transport factor 2 family protein [Undibacterium fentianense]
MRKLLIVFGFFSLLFWGQAFAADSPELTKTKLAKFLDEWHDDAAHSRLAYFDKIAPDGVYIGTDKTERWVRDDFKVWAQPYFKRPVAWAFTAFNRHIAMTPDQSIIWFDEQLNTQMGICQASGVVRKTETGFEIVHYQLSIAVPNDATDTVVAVVKKVEQRARQRTRK